MFRKRHLVSPGFKLPNPHDPVTGNWGPLMLSAPLCRFVLTESMCTADESAAATITHQFSYGARHSYSDEIKVLNLLIKEADADAGTDALYKFCGGEGAAGLAYWDNCQKWVILEMENAGLIGACLAEDHPGRGIKFTIHLGAWDATDDSGGKWVYEAVDTVAAIDWRYGVPYPDEGATGLFEARASDTYGTIYETVALDCDTPGECGD